VPSVPTFGTLFSHLAAMHVTRLLVTVISLSFVTTAPSRSSIYGTRNAQPATSHHCRNPAVAKAIRPLTTHSLLELLMTVRQRGCSAMPKIDINQRFFEQSLN
jgi:hypothetical protein